MASATLHEQKLVSPLSSQHQRARPSMYAANAIRHPSSSLRGVHRIPDTHPPLLRHASAWRCIPLHSADRKHMPCVITLLCPCLLASCFPIQEKCQKVTSKPVQSGLHERTAAKRVQRWLARGQDVRGHGQHPSSQDHAHTAAHTSTLQPRDSENNGALAGSGRWHEVAQRWGPPPCMAHGIAARATMDVPECPGIENP